MKSINKLAASALLALSSASLASAATTVYHVAGATTFRVAIIAAEVQLSGGSTAYATYYGSSLTSSSQSVVQNGPNGSATIKFENNFTGSVGGVQAIEVPLTGKWPTATNSAEAPAELSSNGGSGGSNTTPATGGNGQAAISNPTFTSLGTLSDTESAVPDIAFSDVNPDTTAANIIAGAAAGFNTPTITVNSQVIALSPYVFVANGSSDVTDLSSAIVNPQNFTAAWSTGKTPLALFTGVSTDTNTIVYPVGRDIDAGVRAAALAETGYTLAGSGSDAVTNPVVQYYPLDSTGAIVGSVSSNPIASFELVPTETVDGITLPTGDGGYSSGSTQGKALASSFASGVTKTVEIGYLGLTDAATALKSPSTAVLLPYAGSTFLPSPISTTNSNKILFGQYTFWGYEYLLSTSAASGEASNFFTEIYTDEYDQLSTNGVSLQAITVSRSDDGLNVTPNYLP